MAAAEGPIPEPAQNKALTATDLEFRLQKTGGTAFRCVDGSVDIAGGLFLSAGALNALRRDALSALEEARCAVPHRRELPVPPLPDTTAMILPIVPPYFRGDFLIFAKGRGNWDGVGRTLRMTTSRCRTSVQGTV